jgi:hypothetical protein
MCIWSEVHVLLNIVFLRVRIGVGSWTTAKEKGRTNSNLRLSRIVLTRSDNLGYLAVTSWALKPLLFVSIPLITAAMTVHNFPARGGIKVTPRGNVGRHAAPSVALLIFPVGVVGGKPKADS